MTDIMTLEFKEIDIGRYYLNDNDNLCINYKINSTLGVHSFDDMVI